MPVNFRAPTIHAEYSQVGASPKRNATAGSTSVKPLLLVGPSIGTYGNGVDVTDANFGDSNTVEGGIEQVEVPRVHPQNRSLVKESDIIALAFAAGDPIVVIRHLVNHFYWLVGSSLTAALGAKLVPTTGGLVKVALAHTATALPMHQWRVSEFALSSSTYAVGCYLGLVSSFTA